MPSIKSYTDLTNNYQKISKMCHQYSEPVFITKNGVGDLAVMSIEAYELLLGKIHLYSLIDKGLKQVKQGKVKPMSDSIKSIRTKIELECIS
jgi:PHD/YefM family antitoxin component YafN of YafNO toxin-antitoxin module